MSKDGFVPRAGYEAVPLYRADRPAMDVDLSDSTNQWGVAPSALAALARWASRDISEYPGVDAPELCAAFASYAGVSRDTVAAGCGSDHILDTAMRALAAPGARVAHPAPTFGMIPIVARANGLTPIGVPVRADGDIDADALLATGAEIIYLCTPNNPTGTPHSRAAVETVIRGAPGVVIIDEAYAEFTDGAWTAAATTHPHVLSTRTMSKSFGLAGLRIGFGVGAPALVTELLKALGPYKVNSLGERAGTAALAHDREWMRTHAAEVRTVRDKFSGALRAIGLAPLPSSANFVCVPVADARALVQALYGHGIAVRGFSNLPVVGDVLRIGLAPWPVMERVRDALVAVGAGARS